MTTRYWCDMCNASTDFESHPTQPYTFVCAWCGHNRIERTRSSASCQDGADKGRPS